VVSGSPELLPVRQLRKSSSLLQEAVACLEGGATMTVVARVQEWLDQQEVKYEVRPHMEAYTAQEVAAAAHIPGRAFAKVVMLKGQRGLAMAVLPAKCRVDISRVQQILRDDSATLANEADFEGAFRGCETGAMPAFGNLYGVPVYLDKDLIGEETVAFPAGSHHEVIRIATRDFLRLTGAQVEEF
jgi:Ala-tRNA(Pro) deacylase